MSNSSPTQLKRSSSHPESLRSNIASDDSGDRQVTDDASQLRRRAHYPSRVITIQPLRREDMQVPHAQDLGAENVQHGVYGTLISALGECIGFCGAFPCCPLPNPYREVRQESHSTFLLAVDPGLVYVNACAESLSVVDVKIQIISIGRQTVITRDNVNVDIDSVIYFQITNPYRAAFGITDLRQALVERAQTTLRHVVGARTVQSVVVEREAIALEIDSILSEIGDRWGVTIEGILIKDIIFSPEVSASLSSAAQQKRMGEAKVIAARAEVDAARLMRQAADILASPAAMQIRQLEAFQSMAKTSNSKVIFVPMALQSDVARLAAGEGEGSSSGGGTTAAGTTFSAGMINSVAQM
ncbi:uncharacterized protein EI90DRAFT_3145226 [Cantharellus anzutake]|uniref:uncharacterized protein n=1 Tax=Cantharellus anzutake TaxID=1750568 RepID=UPI001907F961|nr:uncharacterized protein EI90DRAFT_3145226 [Cantharellus anzutake]KAF8333575.1 hypothetical protein EI90DRAFT_3145226 [Cantharellus anzutake]